MRTTRETSSKIIASAAVNLDPQTHCHHPLLSAPSKIQKNNASPASGEKEESGERRMQGGQEKSAVNSGAFSQHFRRRHTPVHESFISVGDLWIG